MARTGKLGICSGMDPTTFLPFRMILNQPSHRARARSLQFEGDSTSSLYSSWKSFKIFPLPH